MRYLCQYYRKAYVHDLGEQVEKMGGRVLVIPAERMSTRTGLAATYRY
jgi:hypothetical protein